MTAEPHFLAEQAIVQVALAAGSVTVRRQRVLFAKCIISLDTLQYV